MRGWWLEIGEANLGLGQAHGAESLLISMNLGARSFSVA